MAGRPAPMVRMGEMADKSYDVVIVGGGVMGCACAYFLKQADETVRVAVVEKDPSYTYASSTLSMANVRIQFSLKENIEISLYAFEFFDRFQEEMAVDGDAPDLSFQREGNLFIADEAGRPAAEEALALQKSLGCRVDWWTPEEIRAHYPLYRPEEFAGGTFGPDDGYIDAYSMLMGFRKKARVLGAEFVQDEVTQVEVDDRRVVGVRLASGERLRAGAVVNCAGAWAAEVASTAGIHLPIEPVKRQIYALKTGVKFDAPLPLTVLPSGLYFRTETGNLILVGKSLDEDPVGFDFTWERRRFERLLWPELADFVPAFDAVKVVRGWAGLYAVNRMDDNAVLGEWPEVKGFYLANGFSGHGLQQGPAVGRYISELILQRPPTLDLSIFGPERVLENRPLSESGIV